ncbi:hypothetical protein GUJ93_ZPchr0005g14387 [Zizania palustris]|uniref:Uncharacterized protein n=1 Tax=Zizania palustris TaxID=103762 RepID=A0A8J5SGT2_ZIZPA|nr:hypothetical protein GUJ93_ZPchr0005g14387 [Zizania palustris]
MHASSPLYTLQCSGRGEGLVVIYSRGFPCSLLAPNAPVLPPALRRRSSCSLEPSSSIESSSRPTMSSSQRPGRHQRRASQSVFVLPENFADLDDGPAPAGGGEDRKAAQDAGAGGGPQPPRPAAGRHRRAMSAAVASREELGMIKEDMAGSYKIGA